MPDARPWLFHLSLRAASWYRGSYLCVRPRRHGLPSGGPVHPRAHGLWVPVSSPRLEESVPPALWRPQIHQHSYTQVLSGQRQQFLFGLPATALQRDVFTVRILIQGNKDIQGNKVLSTKVVPQGSDHVCAGRGQYDLQSGTWEGAMGRWASLHCDQDNTAKPSSLTSCGSKPGSNSSVALGGGCLCSKRSLLINHVSAPESPASTTRKREMMFALDAWKDPQRTQIRHSRHLQSCSIPKLISQRWDQKRSCCNLWQCPAYTLPWDGEGSACSAWDLGSIPGSGLSPGEGNGYPLQNSCLKNFVDGGAWRATVHGVAKSRTRLSN